MLSLEEFGAELQDAARMRAEAENEYTSVALLHELSERLTQAEEVDNLIPMMFEGSGTRGRKLAVHGFDLTDADDSIALAVFFDRSAANGPRLTQTDAKRCFETLENFLTDALSGEFERDREESSVEFQLAFDLRSRGRSATRYRLYLLTDLQMSDRVKGFPSSTIGQVPADYHIWDVERFHEVAASSSGREQLVIDLTEWSPNGIPALEVPGQDETFTTYLAAVPASLLAELYGRHGSRLLEGNVRSYLSARGKINKGIKTTILGEPDRFLAYNNGITATATKVALDHSGALTSITDLQIVNGGQTTASLFYVNRDEKPKPDLSAVFAQMKLVVVDAHEANEMIPQISRYANSQNRVNEADFFANSAFHIRIEALSQRTLAPAQAGVNYNTRWFYERTRGQYQNEIGKLSASQAKIFRLRNPKSQLMTKTDAARYEVSWRQKPHMVSRGAQLNFVAFAKEVVSEWDKSDAQFNEVYFKELVAKGILFNQVRTSISQSGWYESGYLANITTYTVAKLAREIDRQAPGSKFDFQRVWSNQQISDWTRETALEIGERVLAELLHPNRTVLNVTEWAKREECWNRIKDAPITLPTPFLAELEGSDRRASRARDAAAVQKVDDGIAAQTAVLAVSAQFWEALGKYARESRIGTAADFGILRVATTPGKLPSERQAARLLALKATAEARGFTGAG